MSAPTPILHRRDRENLTRLLRMVLASLLLHGLLITSAGLFSRRSSASPFRENSIAVTFREAPPRTPGPAADSPKPVSAPLLGERVTSPAQSSAPPPAQPAPPAKPAKVEKKAPSQSGEKLLPKDSTKAEIKAGGKTSNQAAGKTAAEGGTRLTRAEQTAMDAALDKIRRSVSAGETSAAQAEWNTAMAAAEASLQVQDYRQQAGQKLSDAWTPPVGAPPLSVRVLVRVRQDGAVASYEIIQRSGHAGLDASVERIFPKVKRLDPIPWTLSGETATLGYEFQAGEGGP